MRLINTSTLKLEEFIAPEPPKYAILSHTWGDDEVTFQEFRDFEDPESVVGSGIEKIRKICQLAQMAGLQYVWVDTCCIDKSSSAELSKSINSMYNWYRRAEICYAYLNDWSPEVEFDQLEELGDPSQRPLRWFTRGWTLQELIAAREVLFFDQVWAMRGLKSNLEVRLNLSRITGISEAILQNGTAINLRTTCLGQRMSWAAHRVTTRPEDEAYCLLGIFQVNMPLLYGEGNRAFQRLQEEILKTSTDFSILAWSPDFTGPPTFRGVLSRGPREFRMLGECRVGHWYFSDEGGEEAVMTNKGLRIHTSSLYAPTSITGESQLHYLALGCTVAGTLQAIELCNIPWSHEKDVFTRLIGKEPVILDGHYRRLPPRTIFLTHDPALCSEADLAHLRGYYHDVCRIRLGRPVTRGSGEHLLHYDIRLSRAWPKKLFPDSPHVLVPGLLPGIDTVILGTEKAVGFLQLSITSSTPAAQLLDFLAVIHRPRVGDTLGVRVGFLEGDSASYFMEYTKTLSTFDPVTAHEDLMETCSDMGLLNGNTNASIQLQDRKNPDNYLTAIARVSANSDTLDIFLE